MYDNNEYLDQCDKCKEVYPTIMFTCSDCYKEIATARGWKDKLPYRFLCTDCMNKVYEKAWKYDQLNK